MALVDLLQSYARRIRELRRANAEVPETALAPAFQQLLEALIPLLPVAQGLVVSPEFRRAGVGRPDIALQRIGAPPRAFVELKAPGKPADPTRWTGQDKRQYERFKEFPCWATCNFAEFRLRYRDNEVGDATVVPANTLNPDRNDASADRIIAERDPAPLLRLLEQLCHAAGQQPVARDAPHLAELLAHSARLVRGIVRDRLAELHRDKIVAHPLLQVRQEFRDVLYAHPEAGGYSNRDFDELFSAAFAQTLAFGLLLVREGTGEDVSEASWQHMPPEHPLMRTALRVLSQPEVVQDLGTGFDVICDTVNSFAPEILAVPETGRDPILYFYEDFLHTFDRAAREKYGVYYTPVEVVRYMVSALDRVVRDNLGLHGLSDDRLTILDPATGTGTFLLGIAERVRAQAEAEAGAGMVGLALQNLAGRMFGFELLVGPYAVAHYRLHHALRRPSEVAVALPRLGVFLADTLAEPGAAAAAGALGFVAQGIADERHEANRIKSEQPILAIIGNPPYRRLEEGENRTLVGDWLDGVWDDLKEPVSLAGHGNQLNTFPELSVAFWRWAIWKLFEAQNAPRRGVIAFISNRKFITGWPYAGLRQMLRERFDRIEIVDLRGDIRLGGHAGVEGDQGVFNIQVGTAITLAIADGSKPQGALAEVRYQDSWAEGLFSRQAKFAWLTERAASGTVPNPIAVDRDALDDMRPAPFQNGEWVGLDACFQFWLSGVQTKRDDFIYATTQMALLERLRQFQTMEASTAAQLFKPTDAKPLKVALDHPVIEQQVVLTAYRPLDRRWLYNNIHFIDRRRPRLQDAWGESNLCLYAMPSGTNAGPAAWCHALLPDYHAFRGSYGGYAFPLYDRRPDVNGSNLSPTLVESLGAAYGAPVAAEDVFDAILCLLSASSYTSRFAEDLEDVFPHIPFPAQAAVFAEAVRIGREIRLVETFARDPRDAYRPAGFARVETQPNDLVGAIDYADGAIVLCANGTGRIAGIPQPVWDFAVSGYRILPRWIEGRRGLSADFALVRELREICGRIAELIDLFQQADTVLEATLNETLTREALGFAAIQPETDVQPD